MCERACCYGLVARAEEREARAAAVHIIPMWRIRRSHAAHDPANSACNSALPPLCSIGRAGSDWGVTFMINWGGGLLGSW